MGKTHAAIGGMSSLRDKVVIVGVSPYPKPQYSRRCFDAEGTVVQVDTHRPKRTHLLEVKGWMSRIGLKEEISFVGKFFDG